MKKIINGKIYDTATAKKVASWSDGEGDGAWNEAIYRKHTGEYFLYGEGGPETKYAVAAENGRWNGGERISPLLYAAAKDLAKERLPAAEYAAAFGQAQEEGKTVVTLSLTKEAASIARRAAAEEGQSISAYVENVVKGETRMTSREAVCLGQVYGYVQARIKKESGKDIDIPCASQRPVASMAAIIRKAMDQKVLTAADHATIGEILEEVEIEDVSSPDVIPLDKQGSWQIGCRRGAELAKAKGGD